MHLAEPTIPRTARGDADPAQRDETGRQHAATTTGGMLLLALVTFGDLVLIKATISRVFVEMASWQAWTLSIGLTLASVMLMLRAGLTSRGAQTVGWNRGSAVQVAMMVLAWTLLGAGLFWLRWNAAAFAPEAVSYDGGAAASTGASHEEAERMLAVVLVGVYIVTGVLAWIDGYLLGNPAAKAMRRAKRGLANVERQIGEKESRVARLTDVLAIHRQQLDAIETERLEARQARADLADELKEFSRLQLAMNLGDVRATALVRSRPEVSHRLAPTSDGEGPSHG